jgi:hypothetical protein
MPNANQQLPTLMQIRAAGKAARTTHIGSTRAAHQ